MINGTVLSDGPGFWNVNIFQLGPQETLSLVEIFVSSWEDYARNR
jgi:hypothetical protein